MKLRLEDRNRAIKLRIQGKTYKEILEIIPDLPKSTLSGWLKNFKLNAEQEKRLKENIEKITNNARIKSAWTKRRKKQEKIDRIHKEAKAELPKLISNSLFLVGISLYWAEGGKTQEAVQFSNSDPRLIKIMMKWFKEICNVPSNKLKIHIYIHGIYKKENCEKFWSEVTRIPVSSFGKTTYKQTIHKVKKNLSYKGVCRIDINNVDLFRKITGWQSGVFEKFY
ncbi:MAG TPA: hypothetical protein DIT25_02525 [Candidatus Moranbacteria bacterium]|nr:hypothetical protein [Candidatus Moranbacteria bacterium]